MGVPSLYRWLTQRYPEIKRPIKEGSGFYADNLYLDFNAIIHPCCGSFDSLEETEEQLQIALTRYTERVVNIIRPKKLLYISVDGVSPRSKLNQQRSRRFVKAREDEINGDIYFEDEAENRACFDAMRPGRVIFNKNAITPGTAFMERLDKFIRELIQCKISEDPLWQGLNVIYSNYKVPGEGEQKVMEYIRKHQKEGARQVIYSPDADLIFLGLTLGKRPVYIMREEPKRFGQTQTGSGQLTGPAAIDDKDFVLVDIAKLRGQLTDNFRGAIRKDFDYDRFIADWVFLCFSLGNDFIPTAPCFEIHSNAIDKITVIYIEVFKRTNKHITDYKNGINFDVLKLFFRRCSEREDEFLVEKSRNLVSSRSRTGTTYDPQAEFALNCENGKIRFYIEKMGIKSENELSIACNEYIKGLLWIYNYYFFKAPSWGWYYPYHFAPFMGDLARVSNINISFNLGRPLRPIEQLLSVLPPKSKGLLPKCFWKAFDENKDMYPEEFEIDMFQKCMDWQAVPILPFVEISRVKKIYNDMQSSMSYEEMDRNVVGYPILFSRRPQALKKAESLYSVGRAFEMVNFDEFSGKVFPLVKTDKVGVSKNIYNFKYVNAAVAFTFDQRNVQNFIKNS